MAQAKMNSANKLEGFDRILEQVGSLGWFQGVVLLCMTLQALLSWHHLSAVFLAAKPPHWCKVKGLEEPLTGWSMEEIREISIPRSPHEGLSEYPWDPCTYYDLNYTKLLNDSGGRFDKALLIRQVDDNNWKIRECSESGWEWDDSVYDTTLVTQFNLVCGRRWMGGLIQGTYMGGVLVGSMVFGGLSDQLLGRRNSVLICLVISLISGFGSALITPSFEMFLLLRFVMAAGVAGCYQNCYVLMLEYATPSARAGLGLLGQVSFALGYMCLALMGYFFRDWRSLQLWTTLIGVGLLSYYWILPESARWLIYKGRYDEAYELLKRVAKINGRKLPEGDKEEFLHLGMKKPEDIDIKEPLGGLARFKEIIKVSLNNYWDLLRTPEIRKRTLLIWALFIIVDLVYYGVVFDSATLGSDPYILVFLAGLMELPAYTLVIPCLTFLGRKPTVVGTYLFTALCTFAVAWTPMTHESLRVGISMCGKLFITTCFAVLYLLGAELFPTATRTTGLASAVIMGRIGSILAPFVVDLVKTSYRDMPNVIFGIVSLLAAILSLLLPETKDCEMFDEIEDLENANFQKRVQPPTPEEEHHDDDADKEER